MTQTVWGDDICPVRTDREKERKEESESRAPENTPQKKKKKRKDYVTTEHRERWEERLMGRVKGKQLQHRESLFWSAAKGRSSLPLNR